MSSDQSDSQSGGAGPKDPIPITFYMHRGHVNQGTGLGTFHLEMPASEGMSNTKRNEYPPIVLEIKDEDQMDSLMRMKLLNHENILKMHFFDKDEGGHIRAYVEPYSGSIRDLFTEAKFFVDKETELVPSQEFQEIVSASLNAVDYIIENNLYHGNCAWKSTLYHQDKDGKRVLKLSNFEERKNIDPKECQLGDCHGLANGLEEVSLFVKKYHSDVKPETCCLIDDLAHKLRTVTIQSLSTMKLANQDNPFFWDDNKKRTFCACELPTFWDKPAFIKSFKSSPSAPAMPWNTLWLSDDFLTEMKIYRKANGIKEYNFQEIKDFIRFISGLYTHQLELKKKVPHRTVDAAVHLKHPRILLDLKAATEVDGMDVD